MSRNFRLLLTAIAVSAMLLSAQHAMAQGVVVTYYQTPTVAYYMPPPSCCPPPAVAYYAPPAPRYGLATVSFYPVPAVTTRYEPVPAVSYYGNPVITTTRYGLFGRPITRAYYPAW